MKGWKERVEGNKDLIRHKDPMLKILFSYTLNRARIVHYQWAVQLNASV